jgi:hypothetical protein
MRGSCRRMKAHGEAALYRILGVIMVGPSGTPISTFAVCRGRRPGKVLELTDQYYDRIVILRFAG